MARALEDLEILDATSFLSLPFATMLFAGLGAMVIKVEEPSHGDMSRMFGPFIGPKGISFEKQTEEDEAISTLKRQRGKKSITLNLRVKEGQDIFKELSKKVDVVTENFATGIADEWGIGYKDIREVNPRIIYCSLSGFGGWGPRKATPAFDPIAQATSGVMMTTGFADREGIRAGPGIGDIIPALYAIIGILSALHYREKTGKGEYIDISMQDSLASIVLMEPLEVYQAYGLPFRAGNRISRSLSNAYKTKDGYVFITGLALEKSWINLWKAIGREDISADPKYNTFWHRIQYRNETDSIIEEWTKKRTTEEVVAWLGKFRIPCSEVINDLDVLLNDAHLRERNMLVEVVHPTIGKTSLVAPGMPIKFSHLVAECNGLSPNLGQHNEDVYSGLLGYSKEKIAQLKEQGII